jgi:hypothetical protein
MKSLIIFLSRTRKDSRKVQIYLKASVVVQNEISSYNHGPWGKVGPQCGKPFSCVPVNIEKIFSRTTVPEKSKVT